MAASKTAQRGVPAGEQRRRGSWLSLVPIVVVALGIAIGIQAFLVKPFRIPSESMVPTLKIGQRVLVNRLAGDPERGDVLVFKPPKGAEASTCGVSSSGAQPCPESTPGKAETYYIKRVVGLPGDRLAVKQGRVYIGGKIQDEPFVNPDAQCGICNMPDEIVIPEGQYYMMGDNRGQSSDSRVWGPVPKDNIIGKAFATYWPPGDWGGL